MFSKDIKSGNYLFTIVVILFFNFVVSDIEENFNFFFINIQNRCPQL